MVMVPEQVIGRRLRFEDYQRLPDDQDYEIVEGRLVVAPRAKPGHQIVRGQISYALGSYLEEHGGGVVVPDTDLVIEQWDIYVSPDSMVFLGDRFEAVDPEGWIQILPDLVVEVLSPSTEDYDWRTKRQTYAQSPARLSI